MSWEPMLSQCQNFVMRTYAESMSELCHANLCWVSVRAMSCEPMLSQCQNYVMRTYAESVSELCHTNVCWVSVRTMSYELMLSQCQNYVMRTYAESTSELCRKNQRGWMSSLQCLMYLCRISVRNTMPNQCQDYYAESVSGLLCCTKLHGLAITSMCRISTWCQNSYVVWTYAGLHWPTTSVNLMSSPNIESAACTERWHMQFQ